MGCDIELFFYIFYFLKYVFIWMPKKLIITARTSSEHDITM